MQGKWESGKMGLKILLCQNFLTQDTSRLQFFIVGREGKVPLSHMEIISSHAVGGLVVYREKASCILNKDQNINLYSCTSSIEKIERERGKSCALSLLSVVLQKKDQDFDHKSIPKNSKRFL